ncbi:hypothetical protein IFM89_023559 [Coptis chinensis]|uniref:Uncharacterized protein n=1 Tax=Coptis chinensis TaxID=261450 RepID=A0A835IF68_9MAGN|nr:hypothetical protein IFM89_023559 [Coptis chinensis]
MMSSGYKPYLNAEFEALIERIHPPSVSIDNETCKDCTLVKSTNEIEIVLGEVVIESEIFYGWLISQCRHGILFGDGSVLTDLDLIISKSYICSMVDGSWMIFILTVLFCAVCWVACVLGAAACCCRCRCCHGPAGACFFFGCSLPRLVFFFLLGVGRLACLGAAMDLLVLAAVGMAVFVFLAAEYATPQNSLNQAPYVTQGLAYREYAWKHGASDGKPKPIVCYEV